MNQKFNLIIREENCKQCGICAYLCPQKVLEQKLGHCPAVVKPEACVGCRLCEMRCPDFAIEVEAGQK